MANIGIGNFPQRCAQLLADMAAKCGSGRARVIDVGCSVGGASFQLLEAFEEVTGVDISAHFIDAALTLRKGCSLPYQVVDEGEIRRILLADAIVPDDSARIQFRQADACSLPAEYAGFDAVLAANLLCRLPSPMAFLSRLGGMRGLVRRGGVVMFASPFSWSEEYTNKSAWLGGRQNDGGEVWSAQGLTAALGDEFELVHREDMPFMICEHRCKCEYVGSDVTVWRRR